MSLPDWTVAERCAQCYRIGKLFEDEVTGQLFCAEHAGPLAWHACAVNEYTTAVKLAGHLDVPVEMLRRPAA